MERTRITLVPHTHWDREWYAPFDEFLQRLVAMMDTLIELVDNGFPHFHLDGQVAMVEDYLDVRPERETDIKRFAWEGKLSLGPWFTQMDEFLTSGESHIRNLERGMARARRLGPVLKVGYMPDQFGHIGQMPQILRMLGLERAVVWRGVPREIDKTAFRWEAPDGSSVLTEYMAFGYFNGEPYEHLQDPVELARAMERSVEQLRPFMTSDRMLVMVGADHAGPDATLPERVAAAVRSTDGLEAEIAGIASHLDGQTVGDAPVWRGELRSSARAHLLPNVYSARAHQKRERGRVETLVERYAEPLAALVPGFRWPKEELERAWTLLLWNGAHDSACGCSHDQVARDVDARFEDARGWAEAVAGQAMRALAAQMRESGILRFNPSPSEREGVPGLGWRVEPIGRGPADATVDLAVRDGWVVADGVGFTLRDEPDVGDLYNWCYAQEGQTPLQPDRLEVDGDRVTAVWDGLEIALRVARREGEPFLRLEGAIENGRPDHRLRLHVRLPDRAEGSLAGSPFELVERGLISEGSDLEAASPTWPARGVVLAGGVAAYHEGVFEYEVAGNELVVTLLRCVGTISREHIPTRPFDAGPGVPTPDAQMLGTTPFLLGLQGNASRDELLVDWERFALPILEVGCPAGGRLPSSGTLLGIEGEAVLSNVRRVDGKIEVRLWNPHADRRIEALVAGAAYTLGPAKIVTLPLA